KIHLQPTEGDLLHVETVCAGARRHHLHWYALRRDHRHAQGQAGLAQGRRQDHQPHRKAWDAQIRARLKSSSLQEQGRVSPVLALDRRDASATEDRSLTSRFLIAIVFFSTLAPAVAQ